MNSIFTRLAGIFEVAMSMFGARLLVIQTLSGADGIAQIAAAMVALIAPVCAAVRQTSDASTTDIAGAVADAIEAALASGKTVR